MDALDLDTPALYVDLDVLERNIVRMQEQCRAWGVALRPHVKTHKIHEIAQMQLDAGAIGITVAKVGEAEVLPGADVLVAYPLLKAKLPRLRELAKTRRVKVAVDSIDVARDLRGIETLVEIDVGVGRCGAQSPEQAVEIAKACSDFRGIFYWPSWLDEAGFQAACVRIDTVLDALSASGLEAAIVSGGSTPGAGKTPLIPRTTEIRPGTYVFYDASSLEAKLCVEADCALRVLTTVVSTAVPGQCVIDAGSKTLSSDQTVGAGTFGQRGDPWAGPRRRESLGGAKPCLPDCQPARRNLVRPPRPSGRKLEGRCAWESTLEPPHVLRRTAPNLGPRGSGEHLYGCPRNGARRRGDGPEGVRTSRPAAPPGGGRRVPRGAARR